MIDSGKFIFNLRTWGKFQLDHKGLRTRLDPDFLGDTEAMQELVEDFNERYDGTHQTPRDLFKRVPGHFSMSGEDLYAVKVSDEKDIESDPTEERIY